MPSELQTEFPHAGREHSASRCGGRTRERYKNDSGNDTCAWMRACALPRHVVNDGGEVGGSIELDRLETLVVGLHHAVDASTVRVLWVPVLKGGKVSAFCSSNRNNNKKK